VAVPAPAPRPIEVTRPAAVRPAPEITQILDEPLPEAILESARESASPGSAPLFNPDDPFNVAAAPPATGAPAAARRPLRKWLALAGVLMILATGGVAGFKTLASGAAPALATLSVQSNPSGVPVFVDGVERGVTPARITLAPGAHILELRRGVPRVIPLTLNAGAEVSQYLEFLETPLPDRLVLPDAQPSPAAAPPVAAEPVPAPAAPVAGWVTVKMPFAVEIHENGRMLGTSEADRLMLAAGKHELELVNEPLGFRATRVITVAPGKSSAISMEIPRGVVNLNASPWAEVFLDGQRVGETPIGNLSVPIGPHEIVFRHPQLGERRHAVSVTVGIPVRISVEMKQ
jgi:hypothetical protein